MTNRTMINHLIEDLLCVGILLGLCALIILGPQPASSERASSFTTEQAGTPSVETSRLSVSFDPIPYVSTKSPNP